MRGSVSMAAEATGSQASKILGLPAAQAWQGNLCSRQSCQPGQELLRLQQRHRESARALLCRTSGLSHLYSSTTSPLAVLALLEPEKGAELGRRAAAALLTAGRARSRDERRLSMLV